VRTYVQQQRNLLSQPMRFLAGSKVRLASRATGPQPGACALHASHSAPAPCTTAAGLREHTAAPSSGSRGQAGRRRRQQQRGRWRPDGRRARCVRVAAGRSLISPACVAWAPAAPLPPPLTACTCVGLRWRRCWRRWRRWRRLGPVPWQLWQPADARAAGRERRWRRRRGWRSGWCGWRQLSSGRCCGCCSYSCRWRRWLVPWQHAPPAGAVAWSGG
jgi:hypothetical protein